MSLNRYIVFCFCLLCFSSFLPAQYQFQKYLGTEAANYGTGSGYLPWKNGFMYAGYSGVQGDTKAIYGRMDASGQVDSLWRYGEDGWVSTFTTGKNNYSIHNTKSLAMAGYSYLQPTQLHNTSGLDTPYTKKQALIVLTDTSGATKHSFYFGMPNTSAIATGISRTTDHGYVITGVSRPQVGDCGEFGPRNIFIVKLNYYNFIDWVWFYGDSTGDDRTFSVIERNFNFYIVGTTESLSQHPGDSDILVIEIANNTGSIVRSRVFGGPGNEQGLDLCWVNPGKLVITGNTDHGGNGVFALALDDTLGITSFKTYHTNGEAYATGIDYNPVAHTYHITGKQNGVSFGGYDGFMLTANEDLSLNTDRCWHYGGYEDDWLSSIAYCKQDSSLFMVGTTESFEDPGAGVEAPNLYYLKTDHAGQTGCHEAAFLPFTGTYPITWANRQPHSNRDLGIGYGLTPSVTVHYEHEQVCGSTQGGGSQ